MVRMGEDSLIALNRREEKEDKRRSAVTSMHTRVRSYDLVQYFTARRRGDAVKYEQCGNVRVDRCFDFRFRRYSLPPRAPRAARRFRCHAFTHYGSRR